MLSDSSDFLSDVDIKRVCGVNFSHLRNMCFASKNAAKQKVWITLNDPDDILRHCVSTALKMVFHILTDRLLMIKSVYRIEFDIRLNSFFQLCDFTCYQAIL